MRHLVIVLGDQLDAASSAFDGFDPARDALWMAEVAEESTHVRSSRVRSALFLAAMRHFAAERRADGWTVHYTSLDAGVTTLSDALAADITRLRPAGLVLSAPGDWRVLQALRGAGKAHGLPLDLRDDRHFYATVRDFAAHAKGRKQLRMEYFYREMRQRHRVLMDGDQPCGGQWNFDADNRGSFGADGPPPVPPRAGFAPDALTREVLVTVAQRFPDHPGDLSAFDWPVTRDQALQALRLFVDERLPDFGRWQDAMWAGEPWLWHAHLSAALNLKLLNPREVVTAAEAAYRAGRVPLASAEGFIRQVLGWREYVRGIYWTQMPGYLDRNALDAHAPLPAFYWTGDTDMACLRDAIGQTLRLGYAHHIQRLMVTGLYALLLGVDPNQVHAWYLAVYVDAVEWVELPNTLGMSQYADGVKADGRPAGAGPMASKPYIATGQYIARMSNHCAGCRYRPDRRTGDDACPFTTLYWDFLARHEARFARHPRMALQVKNLARVPAPERAAIAARADALRRGSGA
ncbi:cryptochrome/photolyase family protein [Rubrivivax albus]|uniref:Cryptochrome/photolyase family protein n=1 Tax=Rubrivivax albus TaxID=2499835 RepID=A0A437JVP7_9BURK|nr:cryptochrome/photolyase family protein [Rubrivivax albus]RVT51475.1 cryptochrome/photolyase family protein [Rubrivivax albus]